MAVSRAKAKQSGRAVTTRPAARRPSAPRRRQVTIAEEPGAVCWEPGCSSMGTTAGYCRAHYIKNWATIKRREAIVREGRLRRYIEELVEKFPQGVIEAVRDDLSSNDTLEAVSRDLGLHEGSEEISWIDSEALDESNLFEPPSSDIKDIEGEGEGEDR